MSFRGISFSCNRRSDNKKVEGIGLAVGAKRFILLAKRSNYKGAAVAHLMGKLIPRCCRNGLRNSILLSKGDMSSAPLCSLTTVIKSMFRGPGDRFFGISASDRLTFTYRGLNCPRRSVLGEVSQAISSCRVRSLVKQDIFTLSKNRGRGVTYTSSDMLLPKVVILSRPSSGLSVTTVSSLQRILDL